MILIAGNAEQAACKAIQRSCQRQAEIYAEPPSETIRDAEAAEWQLGDDIQVSETGFSRAEGERFDVSTIALKAADLLLTRR